MTTRVSVIIPTYNRLEFLKEAIASVVAQTYANIELIVVDDGSTDGTGEYIKDVNGWRGVIPLLCKEGLGEVEMLTESTPPCLPLQRGGVKMLTQQNLGVSSARNHGINQSTGELIAFLDSDDLWEPTKIERQVAFFKENPDTMICQTEEIWIRHGVRVNPKTKHAKHSGWIFEKCIPLCIVSPSAVMMRRELFDKVGMFDENLLQAEDYDLWLRTSLHYPIHLIDDPLVIKRGGHADQLSKKWGIDRYRIRALEKISENSKLPEDQRELVRNDLARRREIVKKGERKRKNVECVKVCGVGGNLLTGGPFIII